MKTKPGFRVWFTEVLTEFDQLPDGVHILESLESLSGKDYLSCLPKWHVLSSYSIHQGMSHRVLVWWPRDQDWDALASQYPLETDLVAEELLILLKSEELREGLYSLKVRQSIQVLECIQSEIVNYWLLQEDEFLAFSKERSIQALSHLENYQSKLSNSLNVLSESHVHSVILNRKLKVSAWGILALSLVILGWGLYFQQQTPQLQDFNSQSTQLEEDWAEVSRVAQQMQGLPGHQWMNQLMNFEAFLKNAPSSLDLKLSKLRKDGKKLRMELTFSQWSDFEWFEKSRPQCDQIKKTHPQKRGGVLVVLEVNTLAKSLGTP